MLLAKVLSKIIKSFKLRMPIGLCLDIVLSRLKSIWWRFKGILTLYFFILRKIGLFLGFKRISVNRESYFNTFATYANL